MQLAEHLGVTKQAASEMVRHLTDRGCLRRRPDPTDGRQVLLELTTTGRAATEAAAAETVAGWRSRLPEASHDRLSEALRTLAEPGPLHPAW